MVRAVVDMAGSSAVMTARGCAAVLRMAEKNAVAAAAPAEPSRGTIRITPARLTKRAFACGNRA